MSFGEAISGLVDQSLDPILHAAKSWQRVPLAEVVDILNGYPWPSSGFSTDRGQPVIRIRNVLDGETSTFFQGDIVDGYWIFPGDLLVGMDGDFNRNFWKGPQALLNQRVCKLSIERDFYDLKFLYHVLPGYLGLINKHTSSVTVKHLSSKTLGEIPLPLPPLAEQKRIVAKLDAVFAKSARARTELSRIETLISRYKQAVLSKAFSGDLTSGFRQRASGTTPDEDADATPLWSVPETWSWCRTDQVGRVGLGRQRSPKNHEGPHMRPYLRSANITWQGVDTSDVKEMNFDDADFKRFQLEVGDVLLNEGSGSAKEVGKPAIWHGEIADCCYQNTLLRVQPHRCSSEYAYYYFLLTARAGRFVSSTQGVNIQHIGREGLACYPFPLAPEPEQHAIVRRIESAFAKIDHLAIEAKRALKLVGRLDEAILAKAFRGELIPQDENDEPAKKLLERIRTERDASVKVKSKRIKRVPTMSTARDFLNTKLENWPADGISFQNLKREFGGSYDDLKEAVFASLSDAQSPLQQIFDDKTSTMAIRKRER